MTKLFILTEIGFDTSIENEDSLVKIAQEHCSYYNDKRRELLPIDTLDKAIKYFNNHGFKVTPLKEAEELNS